MINVILTIGDCNGIGIEIMLKALGRCSLSSKCNDVNFTIAGRKNVIKSYCDSLKIPIIIKDNSISLNETLYPVIECPSDAEIFFGKVSSDAGELSANAIEMAVNLTIEGKYDAIVTMPVSKMSLYMSGWEYPGHTEMLADRCRTDEHIMILCTSSIRVALATIHVPLSDVPNMITRQLIVSKGKVLIQSLINDYGITEPMIAVLGLNPHAGENGALGSEEQDVIAPAISDLNISGFQASGPYPADGFFAHGEYKNFDGILAMYHDQGLIPLKLLASGGGVNFTAGLNIVRTSPDHGTAFTIAGKNIANEQSAYEAILLAVEIAKRRKKH